MARAKKQQDTSSDESQQDSVTIESGKNLIFISHDSRDSELAEAFATLLKRASAGVLKSFRSTDKHGGQGIEYGHEWYPTIMAKLSQASEVICLITRRSTNRPWILYEAGVAKGKLDAKVIGLVIGVPLGEAASGPFAQFQNTSDDVDSITKLIMELAQKRRDLDPDEDNVRTNVLQFLNVAGTIEAKLKGPADLPTAEKRNNDDQSVVKIFEEVKVMFDSIGSKIDGASTLSSSANINPDTDLRFSIEDFEKGLREHDTSIVYLGLISLIKPSFPWFFEVMREYHNRFENTDDENKVKVIRKMQETLGLFRHPAFRNIQSDFVLKVTISLTRTLNQMLISNRMVVHRKKAVKSSNF